MRHFCCCMSYVCVAYSGVMTKCSQKSIGYCCCCCSFSGTCVMNLWRAYARACVCVCVKRKGKGSHKSIVLIQLHVRVQCTMCTMLFIIKICALAYTACNTIPYASTTSPLYYLSIFTISAIFVCFVFFWLLI